MRCLASVLVLLLAACAPQKPNLIAERAAIFKADSEWLDAVRQRNVEEALAFWTPDARVIGAGQLPVIGEDAIRAMLKSSFDTPGFSVTWKTEDVVVSASGEMAYSWGSNEFTVPNPNGGADTARNRSIVVWRKLDGQWRAAVDIWTPDPVSKAYSLPKK